MDISIIIIIPACLLFVLFFLPDIFPLCTSCRKYKARIFFKIHVFAHIGFGYRTRKSVCKKCCKKYDLRNISDFNKFTEARKKANFNMIKNR